MVGGVSVISMTVTFTAKYTKIPRGYMGQLVEWPEVITEGKSLEDCRERLQDALHEMILAYRRLEKEISTGPAHYKPIHAEVYG